MIAREKRVFGQTVYTNNTIIIVYIWCNINISIYNIFFDNLPGSYSEIFVGLYRKI